MNEQTDEQTAELQRIVQQASKLTREATHSSAGDSESAKSANSPEAPKKTVKEKIQHELREIVAIIIYLGCWLSVFATMKCLVLLQYGLNEFKNAYLVAWITAAALSKVIVLAQALPIVNKLRNRPLFWACVYKASLFTVITMTAHRLEDKLVHAAHDPNLVFPIAGVIANTLSLFFVFIVLFIYRDLDAKLGKGSLKTLFFKTPDA